MGLFIGSLGRNKVCAVLEPDVELPTDLEGIVPITYVKGGERGSTRLQGKLKRRCNCDRPSPTNIVTCARGPKEKRGIDYSQ
jgi:predicted nucleotide-binding protein